MATREYLDFEPVTQWVRENECDTLLISLPDFSKEQLKVQISSLGALKISGERPVGVNKWSRFSKEFPVSSNCDTTQIKANFSQGTLYVKQPKWINPAENKEKLENNNEPPKYQKPKDDREKVENKTSGSNEPPKYQKPKDDREKLENKTSGSNEPPKYQKPKDDREQLENKTSGSNEPPKSQKPKDDREKLENKTSGSNEPPKYQKPKDDQLQKKTRETTELHKDGQSKPHKTDQETGQTMTKPKDDQLTQIQKGAQELAQITNPMDKQRDQKLGKDYGDLPKKETVADEVPENSSSKEEKRKEIVGNEKNESNYEYDEYDEYEEAINRAMEVGQPSRWMGLVLVVLFIALVGSHLMNVIIEGSEN